MLREATATPTQIEKDRNDRWTIWIRRMSNGDIDALARLYDESSSVIFTLVMQILGDRETAENALVEIYKRALHEGRKFDARRQTPLEWLITLARNEAVERVRSTKPEAVKSVADLFQSNREIANSALARLPEDQRSILEMSYLGGLNVEEIADLLGVAREYVAKQIVFAMKKMRANQGEIQQRDLLCRMR